MMTLIPAMVSLVLFPLAPELWRQGPLTGDTYKVPNSPVVIGNEALQEQFALFKELKNPSYRSRLALELGAVDHKSMFKGLLWLLKSERDEFVRDDLLKALWALHGRKQSSKVDGSVFESCFGCPSPVARCHALSLYLECGENSSVDRVLSVLGGERSSYVLVRLKSLLTSRLQDVSVDRLKALYDGSAKNVMLKCFALELLGLKGDPSSLELLEKDYKDSNPMVRCRIMAGIGQCPGFGNGLLRRGSRDSDPSVRLKVSEMVCGDRDREKILVELLSDSSASVRSTAALGLGRNGRVSSASILACMLADPDIVVRRAVADGLALLKPDREVRDFVISLADREPLCRRQAVRFFHALSDRVAAPSIHRWLKSSKDDLLTEESVRTLGLLDYKESVDSVVARGTSKNENVRKAVADTLGVLNIPSSYGMLERLGGDEVYGVANRAALSMYAINHVRFRDDFCVFVSNRSETGAERRAIGFRGLANLNYCDSKTLASAKALATEACIMVPMAGPMPDIDYVRVSGLLYLYELDRQGNREAGTLLASVLEELLAMDETSMVMTPDMRELTRQVDALRRGEKLPRKEVEASRPSFSFRRLDGSSAQ